MEELKGLFILYIVSSTEDRSCAIALMDTPHAAALEN